MKTKSKEVLLSCGVKTHVISQLNIKVVEILQLGFYLVPNCINFNASDLTSTVSTTASSGEFRSRNLFSNGKSALEGYKKQLRAYSNFLKGKGILNGIPIKTNLTYLSNKGKFTGYLTEEDYLKKFKTLEDIETYIYKVVVKGLITNRVGGKITNKELEKRMVYGRVISEAVESIGMEEVLAIVNVEAPRIGAMKLTGKVPSNVLISLREYSSVPPGLLYSIMIKDSELDYSNRPVSNSKINLGKAIRAYRVIKGVSIVDLGKEAGWNDARLANYENCIAGITKETFRIVMEVLDKAEVLDKGAFNYISYVRDNAIKAYKQAN